MSVSGRTALVATVDATSRPPRRQGPAGSDIAAFPVEAMQVVLLRVGMDTGARSGGIHGPLFRDGSFEYIPIKDDFAGCGVDERTYGNTLSRKGQRLVSYFPREAAEARATALAEGRASRAGEWPALARRTRHGSHRQGASAAADELPEVLLLDDVAALLGCSTTTIKRRPREGRMVLTCTRARGNPCFGV